MLQIFRALQILKQNYVLRREQNFFMLINPYKKLKWTNSQGTETLSTNKQALIFRPCVISTKMLLSVQGSFEKKTHMSILITSEC